MELGKNYRSFKDTLLNGRGLGFGLFFLTTAIGILLNLFYVLLKLSILRKGQTSFEILNLNIKYEYILLVPGILFVLTGIVVLFNLYIHISKREFRIYEDKIETFYKELPETDILFKDIKHLYRFRTVKKRFKRQYGVTDCLAYRREKTEVWKVIKPNLRENGNKNVGNELIRELVKGFLNYNIENSFKVINENEVLSFDLFVDYNDDLRDEFDAELYLLSEKSLKDSGNVSKVKNYNNLDMKKVILEKETIIFDNKKISIEYGDNIFVGEHELIKGVFSKGKKFERSKIFFLYDKNGTEKISIDLNNLVSGELFAEIAKKLLENIKPQENILIYNNDDSSKLENFESTPVQELVEDDIINNNENENIKDDVPTNDEELNSEVDTLDDTQTVSVDNLDERDLKQNEILE